jgi:hypothetical protein
MQRTGIEKLSKKLKKSAPVPRCDTNAKNFSKKPDKEKLTASSFGNLTGLDEALPI